MKKVLILLLAIVILSVFVLAHDQIFLKTTVVADEAKEDPDFYISLGDFFIEDGHTEKAIGAYKQALKLDPKNENSFGLGIWPEGNTPVRIKIKDWGCCVNNNADGKGRVWEFETI